VPVADGIAGPDRAPHVLERVPAQAALPSDVDAGRRIAPLIRGLVPLRGSTSAPGAPNGRTRLHKSRDVWYLKTRRP
jgi:hypothetical protein